MRTILAQSECAHGEVMAELLDRNNGFLDMGGEKMSNCSANVVPDP